MKGTTHLAIGAAIGAAASLIYPFSLHNAAAYLTVSALSALSADLDGPGLLSGRVDALSRRLKHSALGIGIAMAAAAAIAYFVYDFHDPIATVACVAMLLLGLVAKQGAIRNAMVSIVGLGLMYAGWTEQMNWLVGFGLFVVWVPWLKHRGLSHTVWALAAWGAIGYGLERELGIDGVAAVSVAGYASHLIADTLTPSGVKWLYPLYRKSIKLPF